MFAKLSTLMVMFLSAVSMVFASDDVVVRNENNNAYIENNISVSSSSGGQKSDGSGTIKTGNAHSESSVRTNISSSNGQVKVEAQAEVNGKKIEVSSEEKGDSVIEKSVKDENGGAKIYVKTDVQDVDNNTVAKQQDTTNQELDDDEVSGNISEVNTGDSGDGVSEDQSNFIENIINKIAAWFF